MTKQRLIDAKALWKNVEKLPSVLDANNGWLIKKTSVLAKIEDATTVEAKPVVHAHWLEQIIDGGQELMCSNCGEYALMNDEFYSEFSKYCPYCGAQMDEKED